MLKKKSKHNFSSVKKKITNQIYIHEIP